MSDTPSPTGDPITQDWPAGSGLPPVDPTSVLGRLAERREELRQDQTTELRVPRWVDPEIVVVYGLVEHKILHRAQKYAERRSKDKGDTAAEAEVDANCDILINGCREVWAVIGGARYSLQPDKPEAEPTRFDDDLAETLGLHRGAGARAVVKELFMADGDIITTARAVARFSGYRLGEADEDLSGE